MIKKSIIILAGIAPIFFVSCSTTTRTNYPTAYNSDYHYSGKIYPGSVGSVSYGSDFGQGYGLNHGVTDYEYGYGVDDYGRGYGNVDYGTDWTI